MPDLEQFTFNAGPGWREADLHGRKHLVIPAVMMTEGVHPGSQGPVLYRNDFLAKRPASWDHKPVVIYHPKKNGAGVSACDPAVLNTRSTGILLNTKHDAAGKKWTTEVWLDYDRTMAIDKRVIEKVKKNEKVEVSTGLYLTVKAGGTWNGEAYHAEAEDYSPDHLAVLPDQIGACSIKKGAGLLANAAQEPESLQFVLERMIENLLKDTALEMTDNELSFSQVGRQLADLLSARFGEKGKYWQGYVLDVFADYVIYSNGSSETYKLAYTTADAAVTLSKDAPVVVARSVEYRPVRNEEKTPTPTENEMPFDKSAFVAGLITNGKAKPEDKDKLLAADEVVLQLIANSVPAPVPAEPAHVAPPPAMTSEQWLAAAPPSIVENWNEMAVTVNEQKAVLVANILAVPECGYTKEELTAMKLTDLKRLAKLAGAAKAAVPTANGQIPLLPVPGAVNYGPAAGAAPAQTQNTTTPAAPAGPRPFKLPSLPVGAAK